MAVRKFKPVTPKLAADLNQKYGNINLPSDNNGNMDIHVKYGNLNAGNFTANAMIEAKYGNIEVGNLQDAQLDLGYVGTAKIRNAKDLTIDSKYSNLDIQARIIFTPGGELKDTKKTLEYARVSQDGATTEAGGSDSDSPDEI